MPKNLFSLRFLRNYLSTLAFLLLGWYVCFHLSGFHQGILKAVASVRFASFSTTLRAPELFVNLLGLYALILIPYYVTQPWINSKTWVFLRGLWLGIRRAKSSTPSLKRKKGRSRVRPRTPKSWLSPVTRQAALALLLKFFFAPLMINWCLAHIGDMLHNFELVRNDLLVGIEGRALFDHALFWAAFQLILFVDTLLFTLGYIIEMPRLKNRILTVETSFLGWFVCLACYPPFNTYTGDLFRWQSSDFPHFENDGIHFFMNCAILLLMGIYSWASVALGFKASNLTNRGIVHSGPYAWVRHPAYAAKNLAWWIGALPTFYIAFGGGLRAGLYAVFCTAGWSFIYVMRAITEERHLLRTNNGYVEYAKTVRWRFIPGLI